MTAKEETAFTFIAGCGAFIGGLLRYVISSLIFKGVNFPVGTLICNLIGSFLMGLISSFFTRNARLSKSLKIFLTTGILGGFTTFSSFTNDSIILLIDDKYGLFIVNVLINVIPGIALNFVGNYIPIWAHYPIQNRNENQNNENENNINNDNNNNDILHNEQEELVNVGIV